MALNYQNRRMFVKSLGSKTRYDTIFYDLTAKAIFGLILVPYRVSNAKFNSLKAKRDQYFM